MMNAATSTGTGKDLGASGTSTSAGPKRIADSTIAGPTPILAATGLAVNAATRPPMPPSVNTRPISAADMSRVRTA